MQRIRFFDIAKGIAILAVILGHSAIEMNLFVPHRTAQVVLSICFSFHMPLFFILSGYFMHPERGFRWMKEAKQLLFTYVVTALCVLVGVTCMATLDHESRAIAPSTVGYGRDIWKRRYLESDALASGPENRRDLVPACTVLGSSAAALPCKAPYYPCLGGAVLRCRLCFLAICTSAVEHSIRNVCGRVPLFGVSCQEIRCARHGEEVSLCMGYRVCYLGGRHRAF